MAAVNKIATDRVIPQWDEVGGHYIVSHATRKGLGDVKGQTRTEFNESVASKFPEGASIEILYPEGAKIVPAKPAGRTL